MSKFKIFGREPAMWLAVMSSGLGFLVTFNLEWLSAEQAALWVTGINAVFAVGTAMAVRPISPTVFTYAFTTIAALGAAYGLDFSQEQVGTVNGIILALLALVGIRPQSTPNADPHPTAPENGPVV